MNQLRQMEGQRRGLNPQALGDNPGRQPLRPAGDQQTEQRKPGFLGQRAKRRNRRFLIHCLRFHNSTSTKVFAITRPSRDILKIVELPRGAARRRRALLGQ